MSLSFRPLGSRSQPSTLRSGAPPSRSGDEMSGGVAMIDPGFVHGVLAVNPVPWARAQMAFTLACHIILVPLGVSWAFMMLIANYRGLRRNDAAALELAQRWSKYMAVTFAVGRRQWHRADVRVRSACGRGSWAEWGDAFGVPFAFEGVFFFAEAIFVSIYIFGWRRLKPWTHFWTGVPIVLTGVFGAASVVAANAWMNAPSGFTLDKSGTIVRCRPGSRDLQRCDAAHGGAHARRRVRRGWIPGGVGVRLRHAAGPTRPVSPAGLHHRVLRRRRGDTTADGGR